MCMQIFLQIMPFDFGASWMGLWALAAALPLVIHLLTRRKYHEQTWAAMEYLLRAMKKNARRIRIEQLILLLVRAMILILAAAAWMDWMLSSSGLGISAGSTANTHIVLVIDGSYSMAYTREEETRFQRTQRLAAEIVDAANQGDGFTVVLMSDPPRAIISEPAFDPADVKQELAALTLPHTGANLPATLTLVDEILKQTKKKYQRLPQARVCFFSDLQRTTWGNIESDGSYEKVERLAQQAPLLLLDVGQSDAQNLAVTDLRRLQQYVTRGSNVPFSAQVRNFGRQDEAAHAVDFLVDGQPVTQQKIDLPAGDEATLSFTYRFPTPGEHQVSVRLADDPLPTDNQRWLSVPVRDGLRVLCVDGKPGASRYVALALAPKSSGESTIQPEIANESALIERDLTQYDCIFLCNVARFGEDEAAVLRQYVNRGGGLVFFLGDQVDAPNYNQYLAAGGAEVLPAKLGDAAPVAQYRFDPRDYSHPIVSPFRGHERTGLLTTPIWKYIKLEVPGGSPTRASNVALYFGSGDPAIVERQIGRGRSILVATAASSQSLDRTADPPTPWAAFSSWHSFPPLVQEMLALAVSDRFGHRNLQVGEAIDSSVHSTASGIPLEVQPPAGPAERIRLKVAGEDSIWSFSGTLLSGIYKAEFGPPLSATQLFAVNIDPRESNLDVVTRDELPAQLLGGSEAGGQQDVAAAAAGSGQRLYRWFLGGVFVLLLVETYLAWRFGNQSA